MSTLLPQRYREPGARAMPPLTWVGERFAPRATWSCIDDLFRSPVALALRVYPPSQGSGLAASLAPRPWHGQRLSTSAEPQAPRMLDEPDGSPCPLNCLPAHAENTQYEQ